MIYGKNGIGVIRTSDRQSADRKRSAEDNPMALLRPMIAAVNRRLLPLSLWVLVCLLTTYFYARLLPPTYTAASTLILETTRQLAGTANASAADSSLDLNRVDSELQVIRSERMQRLVFDALGLANHPEIAVPAAAGDPASDPVAQRATETAFARFRDRFSARRIGQSYAIEISYSSSDPVLAARVANAGASAYLLQSVTFREAVASGGAEFMQGRLDALRNEVAAASAAVRDGTLPAIQIPNANARIIGAALVPLAPSAPRVKMLAALGGVLGLLGGLLAMAMSAALDRRVGDGRSIRAAYDLDVLASLPTARAAQLGEAGVRYTMALRDLRTAIELAFGADVQQRSRSIALASWTAGTGCSMLAMNLANVMRHGNDRTVVVDADIRGGARGLTAQHAPRMAPSQDDALPVVAAGAVDLLPTQAIDAFSESLANARNPAIAELFRAVQSRGDVLIDLPPLSESADARALARQADAVLIVATPYSLMDEIALARHQLEQSGATILGVAINDPGHHGLRSRLRGLGLHRWLRRTLTRSGVPQS
ncbi:hypothetical protein V8J36_03790 [Frigidibacter sp. MR17.14]|uniref:hypothetical protein n=1 Tax=Frigidibacter sp. MR17.14 TaxID=3126509 RepID=UPI003012E491